jgi:hypothetical protein
MRLLVSSGWWLAIRWAPAGWFGMGAKCYRLIPHFILTILFILSDYET